MAESYEFLKAHYDRIKAEQRSSVERQRDLLRAALVKVVGVDGRENLEQMEGVMRLMPGPAEDKAVTLDAIHALLATLESPEADDAVARSVDDPHEPTPRDK
jgi:hypothetical protein